VGLAKNEGGPGWAAVPPTPTSSSIRVRASAYRLPCLTPKLPGPVRFSTIVRPPGGKAPRPTQNQGPTSRSPVHDWRSGPPALQTERIGRHVIVPPPPPNVYLSPPDIPSFSRMCSLSNDVCKVRSPGNFPGPSLRLAEVIRCPRGCGGGPGRSDRSARQLSRSSGACCEPGPGKLGHWVKNGETSGVSAATRARPLPNRAMSTSRPDHGPRRRLPTPGSAAQQHPSTPATAQRLGQLGHARAD